MSTESLLSHKNLPHDISVQDFDILHDDATAWRDTITTLAARVAPGLPVQQMGEGTVLVALLGSEQVLKLYPPFLRDHFEFERAALAHLHGELSLPTPALLASGEHQGWPYVLMSQLRGVPLVQRWVALPDHTQAAVLKEIGALTAQVHALPVGNLRELAPPWQEFLQGQRSRCHSRQQRTGLPAHLLAQLERFLAGPLPPAERDVILTGEYTPMNLMFDEQTATLCGMFDFGDGLVGAPPMDWLGPLCFLAAGRRELCQAYFSGLGLTLDAELRVGLLRLLLLHRYSNLQAQLALPGWQESATFEELAERLWPL